VVCGMDVRLVRLVRATTVVRKRKKEKKKVGFGDH